jgi:hypothetical protein
MGKLEGLYYELLEHPPCSPDLAPSDFYLFPNPKLFLAGQRFFFFSNQEAIAAVEGYFAYLPKNHCRDRIMALEHRWVLREIVLKNKNIFEIINLFFHC